MHSIINTDQCEGIKERFIGQNARLIQDIFEYTENLSYQEPNFVLILKRPLTIGMEFHDRSAQKINFGENFIKWIKIFDCKANIIIKNNEWLAEPIRCKEVFDKVLQSLPFCL